VLNEPAPAELDEALKKITGVPKLAELWDQWVQPLTIDVKIDHITKYGTHPKQNIH
jgi:hypothetical protein